MKVQVGGSCARFGHRRYLRAVCANLCVCETEEQALKTFKDGDILVIPQTSNKLLPILKKASGMSPSCPARTPTPPSWA
jgi:pyruvate kinase